MTTCSFETKIDAQKKNLHYPDCTFERKNVQLVQQKIRIFKYAHKSSQYSIIKNNIYNYIWSKFQVKIPLMLIMHLLLQQISQHLKHLANNSTSLGNQQFRRQFVRYNSIWKNLHETKPVDNKPWATLAISLAKPVETNLFSVSMTRSDIPALYILPATSRISSYKSIAIDLQK